MADFIRTLATLSCVILTLLKGNFRFAIFFFSFFNRFSFGFESLKQFYLHVHIGNLEGNQVVSAE